jgi:hypothetical protein
LTHPYTAPQRQQLPTTTGHRPQDTYMTHLTHFDLDTVYTVIGNDSLHCFPIGTRIQAMDPQGMTCVDITDPDGQPWALEPHDVAVDTQYTDLHMLKQLRFMGMRVREAQDMLDNMKRVAVSYKALLSSVNILTGKGA